ncbi:hypothetical protein C7B79_06505 [Chroococcidiopsis cubana CCALA 043]|uniref:hypothetical protein n=1 Tax=Chroococcidiopsis TaxID=54298 RepID=UPI000D05B9E2|nr:MULTISPECIES: hypothetical protein [Chroococcidiopsis]PSB65175.1 hypothetical protein C7B79_06505 [Chroococcidiopsis cubana CCALA 043]PSM50442.1 hypothetical protein C7Y66_03875 [Chroococcidiopsis sp. CCALA 051]
MKQESSEQGSNYQLPTTSYQLLTTNYQLPITNHQSPMTNNHSIIRLVYSHLPFIADNTVAKNTTLERCEGKQKFYITKRINKLFGIVDI